MGCAAMKIQDWDVAIKALSRVTSLDNEVYFGSLKIRTVKHGIIWLQCSLSKRKSIFIKKLNLRREAWRALREALRSKYESSNIWENYLFVSVDLLEIQEAIRAMETILNLRIDKVRDNSKLVDIPVLSILVDSVIKECTDQHDIDKSKVLARRLNSLLDLLNSKLSFPEIYLESSRFYESQNLFKKSLEFHQKAYRKHLHDPYVLDKNNSFESLVSVTLSLADKYSRIGHLLEEDGNIVCKDWKYQSRTCLKTVIGRTKHIFENNEKHQKMVDKLQTLEHLS